MVEKKYELTDETIEFLGRTLHRIKALKDFETIIDGKEVKCGDLGGYIESETNLSQEGKCWIADNAKVYDSACVENLAIVEDNAIVEDCARISNESWIFDDARICECAEIGGDAIIHHSAFICGDATIRGNVSINGAARVGCGVDICGVDIIISGRVEIGQVAPEYAFRESDDLKIVIGSDSEIVGDVCIHEPIKISGEAFEKQEDFDKFFDSNKNIKDTLENSVESADRGSEKHSPTKQQER